jgi:hypothetical protein
MNRFYQEIDIRGYFEDRIKYQGIVFAGISFRD